MLKTQYPTVKLLDDAGTMVDQEYPKSAPDHILVHGSLASRAVASLAYRSVQTAVDRKGIRWIITGTKGEVEVTTPESAWQMGADGATLHLRRGKTEQVENIDFSLDKAEAAARVPFPATNTALTYDAFATEKTDRFATFESAMKTHRLLETILAMSKK